MATASVYTWGKFTAPGSSYNLRGSSVVHARRRRDGFELYPEPGRIVWFGAVRVFADLALADGTVLKLVVFENFTPHDRLRYHRQYELLQPEQDLRAERVSAVVGPARLYPPVEGYIYTTAVASAVNR